MSGRLQGRVSIAITLATAIGLLVLVTAGSVLGVGVWLAQQNTFSLLSANADQSIGVAVKQIEQHLQPAEHQDRFIAGRIEQGDVDILDRKGFGLLLAGALAAAPQIEAVMLISFIPGRWGPRARRGRPSLRLRAWRRAHWGRAPAAGQPMRRGLGRR